VRHLIDARDTKSEASSGGIAPLDPVTWLSLQRSPVLLQVGNNDCFVPPEVAAKLSMRFR
jgi:hypothetical protein